MRIGVNDLSVNDPQVFLAMTRVQSGFTKEPHFYSCISFPGTSIGETDPARHRTRRNVLTPALSGTRVQKLAPDILLKIERLLRRFDDCADSSTPICITSACHALTMDIISNIVLGQEIGCIEEPDFRNEFMDHMNEAFAGGWVATAFPTLAAVALYIASKTSISIMANPLIDFKQVSSRSMSWKIATNVVIRNVWASPEDTWKPSTRTRMAPNLSIICHRHQGPVTPRGQL